MADNVASLTLKYKWLVQQLARDLPTLGTTERLQRRKEVDDTEELLRQALEEAASDD